MEDRLRIGFVGAGSMGQCAHLKNFAALEQCQVVAIAELRQDQGRRVAQRYGVPRVYPDGEALLEAEALDGLVASQPFNRHGVLIPRLLRAGVPVFIEKPLAASVASGEQLVRAEQASGTWLMVGYHKRSDPATMLARTEIERLKSTGELGRMTYVRLLMPAGDWVAGGFADLINTDEPRPTLETEPAPDDLSPASAEAYNQFVNYYIHQINLLRHLLGESYAVTYADPAGVLLAGRSDSGVTVCIEMSPYRTRIDWQESALVCFEHGYVKLELPAPLASNRPGRVELFRDAGSSEAPETRVPQLPWVHAMRQQAGNFLAAIRGERAPMTGAAEALEDLRTARQYIHLLTGE